MTKWSDQKIEKIVSALLIGGVSLSALVVLLGGACFFARHAQEHPDYRAFHGVPEQYRSLRGVISAARPSDCRALIQLGLLLLIATPVARVAFSMIAFALERDRTYVVLTAIVLIILLYSFTQ